MKRFIIYLLIILFLASCTAILITGKNRNIEVTTKKDVKIDSLSRQRGVVDFK